MFHGKGTTVKVSKEENETFCISLVLGERELTWLGFKYPRGGTTKELDQLFSEPARLTNRNSGWSEKFGKTAVFLNNYCNGY